jgi:hypothetical protein
MIKKLITCFFAGIILAGSSSFYAPSQSDSKEYLLKAAFLYRFIDYVDWGNNEAQNFNIAVLGESDIMNPLNEISKEKKVRGKSIYVTKYQNVDDIGSCQVLFISRNYNGDIGSVISKIDNKPILIVTEQKNACEEGAHINFLISEDKLKFEINIKAASKANLKISSELLQHAVIINSP